MYRDTKEDQEDLFQEIVLQLWKAFPSFRQEAKVSSWMYRIALNTALAVFRKKKVPLAFHDQFEAGAIQPDMTQPSENEVRLFEAIRGLSEAERALIALYLEDYAYKEIAEIIGISTSNVGVRISRIKAKLRKRLE